MAVTVLHRLPVLPGAAWLGPVAIGCLALLAVPSARWLLPVVALCVWTLVSADRRLDDRLPEGLTGGDFDVIGWVDGFPSGPAARRSFSFSVERVGAGTSAAVVPQRLRLGWYDAPPELVAGEAFALTVRLRAPRGQMNPGGFDYEQWLLVNGFGATGYVRSGERLDEASAREVGGLARRWVSFRREAARRLERAVTDPAASALLVALSIGERYGFTDEQWERLRRSGTSHLVAISGLHVGLVATFVFFIVRRLWLRGPHTLAHFDLEAAAVASAAAAIGYAALAGFALPTRRAVVMVLVGLVVVALRRRLGWGDAFACALLAVIALDPLAVLSASFWLSFGAVGVLLVLATRRTLAPRAGTRLVRAARAISAVALLQLAVSFGLAPVGALFFAEVSFVSPLANLVAIPYFSFVLVPATLIALCAGVSGAAAADALIGFTGDLANAGWALIDVAASVPGAAVTMSPPGGAATAFALLAVVAVITAPLPGRWLAAFAVLPLWLPHAARPPPGTAVATVLDVGHGLAVVIETAQYRLLYDAGPTFPSGFDTGADIVLPALAALGPRDLDLVIVSHDDNDHAGGIGAVLAAHPQASVLKGPDVGRFGGRVCREGEHWHRDGVEFEILHPAPGFARLGNDSSCVLKVSTEGASLLLLGDVERHGERAIARDPRVAADAVVVAHHGSATSSTPELVAAVGARHAVASAGHKNRWNFPREEVIRRWQGAGAALVSTGDVGAVTIRLDGAEATVTLERQRAPRYWHAR